MRYIGNGLCESDKTGRNKYFIIGMEVKPTKEVNIGWGKSPKQFKIKQFTFKMINIVTGELLEIDASSYATRHEANGIENYVDIRFEEE